MDQTTVQLYFHNGIVVLTMLIGLLQAFYGQRFKKQTFFTVGAAAAGWGVYNAVQHFGPNQWDLNEVEMTVTSVSAPIIAAVLGGILLVYIEKLALFALGAGLGGYGVYTLTVLAPAISTAAPFGIPFFYTYLAYALVGIAVGTVAVKTERYIVMLATSAIGTVFFFGGISFFTHITLKSDDDRRYVFVGIMTLFFLLAFIVQIKYTGTKTEKKKEAEQNLLSYTQETDRYYANYKTVNQA